MGGVTEFETLEHQFLELIAEFRTITVFKVYFRNCLCHNGRFGVFDYYVQPINKNLL